MAALLSYSVLNKFKIVQAYLKSVTSLYLLYATIKPVVTHTHMHSNPKEIGRQHTDKAVAKPSHVPKWKNAVTPTVC